MPSSHLKFLNGFPFLTDNTLIPKHGLEKLDNTYLTGHSRQPHIHPIQVPEGTIFCFYNMLLLLGMPLLCIFRNLTQLLPFRKKSSLTLCSISSFLCSHDPLFSRPYALHVALYSYISVHFTVRSMLISSLPCTGTGTYQITEYLLNELMNT